MARPRSFDTDTALDAALETFWSHGYEGTSISDLTEAMGIQRGSLYQAFGDKKALFLSALERYLDQGREMTRAKLAGAASAADGLREWLESALGGCPSKKGCFLVNATVEMSPHDSDVARITQAHWRRMEEVIAEAVERGQEAGELRSDVEPRDLARLVLSTLAGAQALDRQKARRDVAPGAFSELVTTLIGA
ncbi:MAG: TetR/AcrR family transcriptional regulator [Planctomycetota bacterium]